MTHWHHHPALATQAMPDLHPGSPYPNAANPGRVLAPHPNDLLALGKLGAVVGLCGAGAQSLRRLRDEQITGGEALFRTLRTGVAAGLATATAGLVASQFRSPLAALAATLVTGTAVMYVLASQTPDLPAPQPNAGEDA